MKILVVHASAGAGHTKAAEALYQGLIKNPANKVTIIDSLDYTSPSFKNLYRGSYTFFVTKIPGVWGFCFWLLDQDWLQPLVKLGRRIYNGCNAGKLEKLLKEENFDYIFSTHFLASEVAPALKRKGLITSKIVTIVTDFDVHRIWLAQGTDSYTVASPWTKEKIKSLGVDDKQIFVTGIPTDEKFARQFDKLEAKKKLGLEPNAFTVLMATGSFGTGPLEEILEALKGFQVVVVCGHNKALYEKLSQTQRPLVKILGLVNNMPDIMAAADVMVTKPGGLSISEALISFLPLIFFNPIPGQETNNIMVLKKYGIGISDCTIPQIADELQKFRSSPDLFVTAVKKTQLLACPNAVRDIIALIK